MTAYRLIDPGSEWRLRRHGYERSARGDLLGEDTRLAGKDRSYRCLDHLLPHKAALFDHLTQRWKDLFGMRFEVLPGNTADRTTLHGLPDRIEHPYGKADRV